MDKIKLIKRTQIKEMIETQLKTSIEKRIDRYLEIECHEIIGGQYFSEASSECIYLYRDGYFIGAVMMSHAINEGIIKFVAERNDLEREEHPKLIEKLLSEKIVSHEFAEASIRIWKSYRNDTHHMNPKVAEIPFEIVANKNLKDLAIIEKEIFAYDLLKGGAIAPHQPKYWDLNKDGMMSAYLRFE